MSKTVERVACALRAVLDVVDLAGPAGADARHPHLAVAARSPGDLLANRSRDVRLLALWLRTAAAILIGIAGIVGVFFAVMEVQGWSF